MRTIICVIGVGAVFSVICCAVVKSVLTNDSKEQSPYATRFESQDEREVYEPVCPPTNFEVTDQYYGESIRKANSKSKTSVLHILQRQYNKYLGIIGNAKYDDISNDYEVSDESPLTCLEWRATVPETVFCGESVPLIMAVKNQSNHEVISGEITVFPAFYLCSIHLMRKEGESFQPVTMTRDGAESFYAGWSGRGFLTFKVPIKPGEERPLQTVREFDLRQYYDLSKPGEYKLTFYTRRFLDENGEPAEDQEREYPRKTTVRFTILPKSEETSPESE